MTEFLIFTLTAPMGSFGDLAGHERRRTNLWPGRSAILGLLGAALGIRRDEVEKQRELDGWNMAISSLSKSRSLRDYHTVQSAPAKVRHPNSRREALCKSGRDVKTTITYRDYQTDMLCFGVAIWSTNLPCPLDKITQSLRTPTFVLYLGRKSCPLSAPVAAKITTASDPIQALAQITIPPWLQDQLDPASPVFIASDPFEGLKADRTETRWDQPLDRQVWHFSSRSVSFYSVKGDQ